MHFTRLGLLAITVVLGACSTSAEKMFPTEGATDMREVFRAKGQASGNSALLETRSTLRRPLQDEELQQDTEQHYTRSAAQEINAQFVRLPNPDLVMYVFPHLAGNEGAPIPGYSTVFPLHQKIHYALPGERVAEDR